ncbi:unnamed protein product [Cuscuta epithymum]|uniref:Uncharacterized protein n=1 Tax=Cuscuta epithymum TaxID=186058 RepID=A0AAV0FY51_9ASTE|nr:unnamed protein product [Cuscuta epithymum]
MMWTNQVNDRYDTPFFKWVPELSPLNIIYIKMSPMHVVYRLSWQKTIAHCEHGFPGVERPKNLLSHQILLKKPLNAILRQKIENHPHLSPHIPHFTELLSSNH